VGAVLDCHSNWTAAWHLMKRTDSTTPPCTVTAEFSVKLRRPTPTDRPLQLKAHVVESTNEKVVVDATLEVDDIVCATCRGVFVAVQPGHPAYRRW